MNKIYIALCGLFLCVSLSCNKINVLSPMMTEIVYLEEYEHSAQFTGSDVVFVIDSFAPADLRFSMPIDTSNETFIGVKIRSAVISWDGDIGILENLGFSLDVDGEFAASANLDITANMENIPLDVAIDLPGSIIGGLELMIKENRSIPLTLNLSANNALEEFDVTLDLKITYSIIMSTCQEMPPGLDLLPCQL